jgi:hypothetical protein
MHATRLSKTGPFLKLLLIDLAGRADGHYCHMPLDSADCRIITNRGQRRLQKIYIDGLSFLPRRQGNREKCRQSGSLAWTARNVLVRSWGKVVAGQAPPIDDQAILHTGAEQNNSTAICCPKPVRQRDGCIVLSCSKNRLPLARKSPFGTLCWVPSLLDSGGTIDSWRVHLVSDGT